MIWKGGSGLFSRSVPDILKLSSRSSRNPGGIKGNHLKWINERLFDASWIFFRQLVNRCFDVRAKDISLRILHYVGDVIVFFILLIVHVRMDMFISHKIQSFKVRIRLRIQLSLGAKKSLGASRIGLKRPNSQITAFPLHHKYPFKWSLTLLKGDGK